MTGTLQRCVDGVYTVTLNNPAKRNAFTPELYRELKEATLTAGADHDVRVLVIEGAGGYFSSGGDIKVLLGILSLPKPEQESAFRRAFEETLPFQSLLDCPKPVVAKIDGLCLAGGLIIAALADAAVATERSSFGVPEGLAGLTDPFCPVLLPGIVGSQRARYLMMSGATIDASQAAVWGLILRAVPQGSLDAAVRDVTDQFKRTSPESARMYKSATNRALPRMDVGVVLAAAQTASGAEGLAAFSEKRLPAWRC